METNVKTFYDARDNAARKIFRIREYAEAFEITGNETMAFTLNSIADSLVDDIYTMQKAYDDRLNEQYNNVMKTTAGMFKAILNEGNLNGRKNS